MGWVAALLAGSASAFAGEAAHVRGPSSVTSLPEHRPIGWKMEVLDGPPFDLSADRGKVVFVNIFATWCGPCRHEQPTVVAFANAHQDDTIVVGMNYKELDDKVREYRKKFDIPYPIGMDRRGNILRGVYKGGDMVFPMTIVFRPDGTLAARGPAPPTARGSRTSVKPRSPWRARRRPPARPSRVDGLASTFRST